MRIYKFTPPPRMPRGKGRTSGWIDAYMYEALIKWGNHPKDIERMSIMSAAEAGYVTFTQDNRGFLTSVAVIVDRPEVLIPDGELVAQPKQ